MVQNPPWQHCWLARSFLSACLTPPSQPSSSQRLWSTARSPFQPLHPQHRPLRSLGACARPFPLALADQPSRSSLMLLLTVLSKHASAMPVTAFLRQRLQKTPVPAPLEPIVFDVQPNASHHKDCAATALALSVVSSAAVADAVSRHALATARFRLLTAVELFTGCQSRSGTPASRGRCRSGGIGRRDTAVLRRHCWRCRAVPDLTQRGSPHPRRRGGARRR